MTRVQVRAASTLSHYSHLTLNNSITFTILIGVSLSEPHLVCCMAGGGVGMYVTIRSTVKFLLSARYKFARYENGCRSLAVQIFPSERFQ